ncbi:MAG: hypothetical protein V4551_04950 [Pseudomonadota bacterium]|jgi:hypothetical protein
MRSDDPFRKRPDKGKPQIWASGGQRPPFDVRALGRAGLYLARTGVAPLQAWAARKARRMAINVWNGAGRIPAERLGRAARLVPSHLRVAGWIKTVGATLSHASATADPDVKRGNALVAEIAPHLWVEAAPAVQEPVVPDTAAPPPDAAPVVLTEPAAGDDPLASIRGDLSGTPFRPAERKAADPATAPAPPGPVAEAAIQVSGYLIGWASVAIALPFGLLRALWLWLGGRDLKTIGQED